MDPKTRKTISWSLSVLIHSVIVLFLARVGYQYAFPEGEVTSSTTVEVVGGGAAVPKVQEHIPAPPTEADEAPKALPKEPKYTIIPKNDRSNPIVIPAKTNEPPPKFVPAPQYSDVSPEEAAPTESPVADSPATEAAITPPKESNAEPTTETTPAEALVQADAGSPTASPATGIAPVGQAESPVGTPTQATAIQTQGTPSGFMTDENGQAVKIGSTQGLIDESQLQERQGNPRVRYPYMARMKRQQGLVRIWAYVKSDGSLSNPTITQSSGFPLLDEAALKTFSLWKYQPPRNSGPIIKPFNFSIKE